MIINKQGMDTAILNRYVPSIFAIGASEKTSNKYLHIPTSKIVDGLLKNDFIVVSAKQTRSSDRDHAKHALYLSHKSIQNSLINKGDELPLIRIQNSHDGKSSFQIDTGFFRLVCSNGLIMPSSVTNSARITHRVGMEREVIEASYRVLNSFDSQIAQVKTMKEITLSDDERGIFIDSAKRIVFSEEQIAENEKRGVNLNSRLLHARRYEDQKNDLWTTFNRVQENAIKGGLRVITESGAYQKMREVKSIDREKQINVELMLLAQKMAELKGHKLAA